MEDEIINGTLYYNSNVNRYEMYLNGRWIDCVGNEVNHVGNPIDYIIINKTHLSDEVNDTPEKQLYESESSHIIDAYEHHKFVLLCNFKKN